MRFSMIVMGSLYVLFGMFYMKSDLLWGLLVTVIGAVYLFGLENYGSDENRHVLAHVVVGGIMSGFAGGFLILEKLIKMVEESPRLTTTDALFLVMAIFSIYLSIRSMRKFGQ